MNNLWKQNRRQVQIRKTAIETYGSPDCPGASLDVAIEPILSAWRDKSGKTIDVCAWDGSLARALLEMGVAKNGTCNNFMLGSMRGAEANMMAVGGRWQHALTFDAKKGQKHNFDSAVLRIPYWLGNRAITGLIQTASVALRREGHFVLAGQKKWGVRTHEEWASRLFGQPIEVSKAGHFRVSIYRRPDTVLAHAIYGDRAQMSTGEVEIEGKCLRIATHPVVYSSGKLDTMTRMLIQSLPNGCDRVLDFGSGTGVVAAWLGRYGGAQKVVAVDANVVATECTDMTLRLNGLSGAIARTRYFGEGMPDGSFELIACYPPFHVGTRVEHVVAMKMICEASRLITRDGAFHIAMTSAQRYDDKLNDLFEDVKVAVQVGNRRVLRCKKPRSLHNLDQG
tara:strand:+ start:377 stop:1561 length:1185 start_codon:yes stop_codon:yes gene_type:complete